MRKQITITLALAFTLSCPSTDQSKASAVAPFQSSPVYLAEGLGVDGITVGYSTASDVVAKFGKDFRLTEHRKYSYEMAYDDAGLSFWYRYDDTEKKIFTIAARPSSRAFTARGIVVGKSTLQDVFNAYGESEFHSSSAEDTWSCAYPGVEFYVAYDPKERASWTPKKLLKKKIIEIDIVAVEAKPKRSTAQGY